MDWVKLINKHESALVLYARQWSASHADAEDTVQAAFLKVWKIWKRNPSKWAGQENENGLVPYLYRAVKSTALDNIRSRNRRRIREEKAGNALYDENQVFKCGLEQKERSELVQKALESLPEEQKEVLVMKIWGDQTFKVISESLDISINTAASRYRYGLAALRNLLDKKNNER